jgi:hypothetical protein
VDFSQAVIITFAYRGLTFWLPLAIGAWALRSLNLGEPVKFPPVE